MGIPGVPAEGLKTVGQITPTNSVQFRFDQDAASIAVDLVKDHATGGPVVDVDGHIVGFISEIDLLEAARAGHGSSVPIEHHHTKGSLIIARESGEYRYFNRAACTRFND